MEKASGCSNCLGTNWFGAVSIPIGDIIGLELREAINRLMNDRVVQFPGNSVFTRWPRESRGESHVGPELKITACNPSNRSRRNRTHVGRRMQCGLCRCCGVLRSPITGHVNRRGSLPPPGFRIVHLVGLEHQEVFSSILMRSSSHARRFLAMFRSKYIVYSTWRITPVRVSILVGLSLASSNCT